MITVDICIYLLVLGRIIYVGDHIDIALVDVGAY